ncbi:MAG TPA: hypothetical protein VK904_08995 [Miltoncostaeaceae bacterium]|nr:hypothetical protein [Miltoncostaeaceae bacterium]
MSMLVAPPDHGTAIACLRGVLGALTPGGRPLTPVQSEVLAALVHDLWGIQEDVPSLEPMSAGELAALGLDLPLRRRLVQMAVTLELLLHPLPDAVADRVTAFAGTLGVREPTVRAARHLAHDQLTLMYACIQRNSWYPAETRRGLGSGHLFELVRSKLSYYAVAQDDRIAARWRALGGLPADSWGRGVYDFYKANGFPFPGERHGIYEIGAKHDWVHVLTDYGTTPEGEIDVFAFIGASMPDPQGFVLLVVTLGIFQNGSIRHMFGRPVPMGGTDALAVAGGPQRFAEAVWRGETCGVDVLGIDHFALAGVPLEEARARFRVEPRRA